MTQSRIHKEITLNSNPFIDIKDFDPLIEEIKDKKIVFLGESTHGTKEFYDWRTKISADLIREYGFNFIAVEGDWPPCQEINRLIQNKSQLGYLDTLKKFTRWPTWMWANAEMMFLIEWLRSHNSQSAKLVGFHGLDVYSIFDSIEEVIRQLNDVYPKFSKKIKKLYDCFGPYWQNERNYVCSIIQSSKTCESEATEALDQIFKFSRNNQNLFEAIQNAKVIKNAERYYRSMVHVEDNAWNIREWHMQETLEMLLNHYGPNSKGIVWGHNSHIGDYKGTDFRLSHQISLGGISRERLGVENVAIVGFTTYTGFVLASQSWKGEVAKLHISKARSFSLDHALHESVQNIGHGNYYLRLKSLNSESSLNDFRGHRAIGVVYQPEHENKTQYIPTNAVERYDYLVFFDQSHPLTPLGFKFDRTKMPETYPFGSFI